VVSCPNYPSLQNYAVLGSPKTTSFCPKRRSFGYFRFYFLFFIFFKKRRKLKKKKRKKKEKKKGKSGWLEPPPSQKWGGRTTPFLAKGWLRPPHTGRMGVAEATPGLWGWSGHPGPLGVVRPPRKAKKKKKKKNEKMGLGFWGWPDHPQGPEGGFGHPL
jgi:hypothetical protein